MPAVPHLRRDLQWLPGADASDRQASRQVLLLDPLRSTFARIDREAVEQLATAPSTCEPQLLASANAAGLLRSRRVAGGPSWHPARLFSIRLPGLNSAPLAAWLARRTDWLFGPVAVVCWCAVMVTAMLAIPVYWERFHANLPGLQQFFSTTNAPLLLTTLVLTKGIHELAHATVCHRMGARPGAIGVLLLCGAPCPYCDVSDSWRLPSRFRRIAIMLAGVYVEWILAAVALAIWWFTPPGTVHFAAMNVMVVCGVSTFLFNLNPLMRYDGYYVLADLCDSTNLRQESADAFSAVVLRRLAGKRYRVMGRWSTRNAWLSAYFVAAKIYRVFITVMIATWLLGLAEALALRPAGIAVASLLVWAIPLQTARQLWATLRGAGAWRDVGWPRRTVLVVAVCGLGTSLLFYPLPSGFQATGIVELADAVPVYLPAEGRIARVMADYGDVVVAGQPLLQLENLELKLQATEIAGKRQALQTQTDALRRRAIDQTDLLTQWDSQVAALDSLTARSQTLDERLASLRVDAPVQGHVLPPSQEMQQAEFAPIADPLAAARLAQSLHWSVGGTGQADGCWCRIGDPAEREVILQVDADKRPYVQVGDAIRVRCDQSPTQVLTLQVTSISTDNRSSQGLTGTQTHFQVACRVPSTPEVRWQIGASATARLKSPQRSLAHRSWHWLRDIMDGG